MKNLSLALLLVASMAFVLVGCSDNSAPLVSPEDAVVSSVTSQASLAKGDVLNSATGSAHYKFVSGSLQSRVRFSFSAVRHANGTCSGEVQNNDEGPTFNFHGKVFDLKVEDNAAKFAFKFSYGTYYGIPFGDWYGGVDISAFTAWCVVVDNGQGKNATGADLVSWILWTDGSDIGTATIEDVNAMGPQAYLNWIKNVICPMYNISYDDFLGQFDNGSIRVK
jgi:hypothetical protein